VLTTCASDYVTWRDEFPAGVERTNGLAVRRFPVSHERNPLTFGRASDLVFHQPHSVADELHWLDAEGPAARPLIDHLARHAADYDHCIFFSYRYYHAYHGVRAVGPRAVLVPTAERDLAAGLSIFPPIFRGVRVPDPAELPPLVALVGTSMDAGKTTAAAALVRALVRRGLTVAAGKLTGVSLRRDVLMMQDCGARPVAIFTDFGVVTTSRENAVAAAHALVAHLAESRPDLIVLEMGDGLLGTYGVDALLADELLAGALRSVVLCAQDPVGAWGAQELLRARYGLEADVVSGRVTDGVAGVRFCNESLRLPGHNALRAGEALAEAVLAAVRARSESDLAGSAR
jgi:hypothetical protein